MALFESFHGTREALSAAANKKTGDRPNGGA